MTDRPHKHCSATTKEGLPCPMYIRADKEFCYCHDPSVPREQRIADRTRSHESRRRTPKWQRKMPGGNYTPADILGRMTEYTEHWLAKIPPEAVTAEVVIVLSRVCLAYAPVWDRLKEEEKDRINRNRFVGWKGAV